jgi:hypothetical protein
MKEVEDVKISIPYGVICLYVICDKSSKGKGNGMVPHVQLSARYKLGFIKKYFKSSLKQRPIFQLVFKYTSSRSPSMC